MPYPDFLGIGVQKSGTSWMHYQFRKHPEIDMPPIKEIHHFDRSDTYRIKDIFKNNLRGRFVRSVIKRSLNTRDMQWGIKYLMMKCTDSNYASLFTKHEGSICGEFTPAYARLDENRIADISKLMPYCKLIYLVRNPMDRIWSQIKMFKRRGYEFEKLSYKEVIQKKKSVLFSNSSYSTHLSQWEKYFATDQIFVGFFEQIAEDPKSLLSDVYEFLGVKNDIPELYSSLDKTVNPGNSDTIPEELKKELATRLLPEFEFLNQRFRNTYTKKWLDQALKSIEG